MRLNYTYSHHVFAFLEVCVQCIGSRVKPEKSHLRSSSATKALISTLNSTQHRINGLLRHRNALKKYHNNGFARHLLRRNKNKTLILILIKQILLYLFCFIGQVQYYKLFRGGKLRFYSCYAINSCPQNPTNYLLKRSTYCLFLSLDISIILHELNLFFFAMSQQLFLLQFQDVNNTQHNSAINIFASFLFIYPED